MRRQAPEGGLGHDAQEGPYWGAKGRVVRQAAGIWRAVGWMLRASGALGRMLLAPGGMVGRMLRALGALG